MAKTKSCRIACELAQLKAKLIATDENGYGKCVSCGEVKSWGEFNGGHFQPKGRCYNGACLDPRNVHLQCTTCNLFHGGNPAGYVKYMQEEYGDDVFEELFLLSKKTTSLETAEKFIIECREECKNLAKDKNFNVKIP